MYSELIDASRTILAALTCSGLFCLAVGCQPERQAPAPKAAKRPAPAVAERVKPPPKAVVPADAYKSLDEAIAAFFSAAKANKLEDFQRAEEWLVMQGDKAIEPLGSILNNEQGDMAQRIAVCRPLRRLGPHAKPALKQALTSPSQQLQLNAMAALGILKPTDDDIIQTLVGYLEDKEERVRREAILALANVGPPAKDACTDKLLVILNNMEENETLRDAAKLALKHVNPRRTFND